MLGIGKIFTQKPKPPAQVAKPIPEPTVRLVQVSVADTKARLTALHNRVELDAERRGNLTLLGGLKGEVQKLRGDAKQTGLMNNYNQLMDYIAQVEANIKNAKK